MTTVSRTQASRARLRGGQVPTQVGLSSEGHRVWFALAAVVLVVLFLAPYVWTVSSSLNTQVGIFKDVYPLSIWTFIPRSVTFAAYKDLFVTKGLGRALLNSALVAVGQVGGMLLLCVPGAYAFSRVRLPGKAILFGAIMVTFMVPGEAMLVPLYRLVIALHIADTLPAVFLPWIASPFALFLIRNAMDEVPRELDEAGYIDGASRGRILWRILLPNIKPTIATASLMTFLFSWNAFLWPLVAAQGASTEVVQVAIAQSTVPGELPNWPESFAGAVIAALPVIALFMLLQRYFVRGVAHSGTKG